MDCKRTGVFQFFLFCMVLCYASTAFSAVVVVQALSFGNFVSKNNDAQYDITINTDGSYSFDSAGFILIDPPQEGIYDIDGLNVSAAIVSVSVTQIVQLTGAGNAFQMVDFQETHPSMTDGLGQARITIGATARTSGAGTTYRDARYSGTVEIEVNF
ncbi:MAG: DUF4402 domain-containing protein [Alphaproteobacteria bacterium]